MRQTDRIEKCLGVPAMTDKGVSEYLAEGKSVRFQPRGFSMYPLIISGRDEVIVEPASFSDVKKGDVVVYRRTPENGGILVIHRIVKKTDEGMYLSGDNQTEVEGPLMPSQLLGKMTYYIRKGKMHSVDEFSYRAISGLWRVLRPVRRPIQKAGGKILRALKKEL